MSRTLKALLILGAIVAGLVFQNDLLEEFTYSQLLPRVPMYYFQKFVWLTTCLLRDPYAVPCRSKENENDLWVLVATAKGGVVVSARVAFDVGRACGACVGLGHRFDSKWPPSEEFPPSHRCDLLLALANMFGWQKYAQDHGGGEYALREYMDEIQKRHARDIEDAVNYVYQTIGKQTLEEAHAHITSSLARGDCLQIKLENLERDFDATMIKWFSQWQITEPATQRRLLEIARKHDFNRKSEAEMAKEHHKSGRAFNASVRAMIDHAIRKHVPLMTLVQKQATELGYESPDMSRKSG